MEEKPIIYVDEQGNLSKEVKDLLQYLSQKPDLILATGHGTVREIDVLIAEAVKAGVKKIFVNHPFFLIGVVLSRLPSGQKWVHILN